MLFPCGTPYPYLAFVGTHGFRHNRPMHFTNYRAAFFCTQNRRNFFLFQARHLYICDYHKNLIQSVRNRRKRKGSDDDGGDSPVQDIDTPEVDETSSVGSVNHRHTEDSRTFRSIFALSIKCLKHLRNLKIKYKYYNQFTCVCTCVKSQVTVFIALGI